MIRDPAVLACMTLLALCVAPLTDAATRYECRQTGGVTTYENEPCPGRQIRVLDGPENVMVGVGGDAVGLTEFQDWVYASEPEELIVTPSLVPGRAKIASLALACHQVEGLRLLSILYNWRDGIEVNGTQVQARYRIDDEAFSSSEIWTVTRDKETGRVPWTLMPDFLPKAQTGHVIEIEVTDPSTGKTIADKFSLNGFTAATGKLGRLVISEKITGCVRIEANDRPSIYKFVDRNGVVNYEPPRLSRRLFPLRG